MLDDRKPTPLIALFLAALLALGACGRQEYRKAVDSNGEAVTEKLETLGPSIPDEVAALPPDEEAEAAEVAQETGETFLEPAAARTYCLPRFNPSWGLSRSVYDRASHMMERMRSKFRNQRFVALVDFSKHSRARRFFLFDLKTGRVDRHAVAHGRMSDPGASGYAQAFSNRENSLQSSLGVYRTLGSYQGSHGLQLRLDGLEPTNSNARQRAIVVHGASYVSDSGKAGRSWGCPALDPRVAPGVIHKIRNGAMLMTWK